MRYLACVAVAAIVLAATCSSALAQDEPPTKMAAEEPPAKTSWTSDLKSPLGVMVLCGGAALVLFAGARGISTIGTHAVDAIARQPEAAGGMFMAWLLTAMMIEVATMFGMVICYMAISLLHG